MSDWGGTLTDMFSLIDLFAGAGGLSEGLRAAGFRSLYANEVVPRFAATFKINHPHAVVESRDIREVNALKVRQQLGLERGQLDLLAGGPPCQGFSINAPLRSLGDQRNHLFRDFLRFVEEFQPRAVLIENVPGLVSFAGGATLEAILESLRRLGYAADVQILYAPHFGVPQTRWRTVVIGLRDASDALSAFPTPQHDAPVRVNFTSEFDGRRLVALPRNEGLPRHVTVRDAIGDLPPLASGEGSDDWRPYPTGPFTRYQELMRRGSEGVSNHAAPRLSSINLERISHVPQGGNWTNIPPHLLPQGMKRARTSDHTKRYGRVHPEGLASTILTKCDPHWGAYIHYDQDRAFTVREAARLQSFPDRYVFEGTRAEQYAQVGNAVPPLLATAVGAAIASAIDSNEGQASAAS